MPVGLIQKIRRFRWTNTIWQNMLAELAIWSCSYAVLSVIYRFALNTQQQDTFGRVAAVIEKDLKKFPVNMMLGFFVQMCMNRWQTQCDNLGLIDFLAVNVSCSIRGHDEETRILRRTILRYCCLSQVITFRKVHKGIRERFTCFENVVASGIMTQEELNMLDKVNLKYIKNWVPLHWANQLVKKAFEEKKIAEEVRNAVVKEISVFNDKLLLLMSYNNHTLPRVNSQVILFCVHCYFLFSILCRQYFVYSPGLSVTTKIDLYIPFIAMLEFMFNVGWMQVGLTQMDPMGDDPEDIDLNFLVDRNMSIAMDCAEISSKLRVAKIPEEKGKNEEELVEMYSKSSSDKCINITIGSANNEGIRCSDTATLKHLLKKGTLANVEVDMLQHPENVAIDDYLEMRPKNNTEEVVCECNPKEIRRLDIFPRYTVRYRQPRKTEQESDDKV